MTVVRLFGASLVLLTLGPLAGCGSQNDKLARESVRLANRWADQWEALAAQSNGADTKEAEAVLSTIQKEMIEHRQMIHSLPESDRLAIASLYHADLAKAADRAQQARKRLVGKQMNEKGVK